MKKYIYTIIMGLFYAVCGFAQIPVNKTVTTPENGTVLHQAVVSIKFDKGYSYTPAGGTLTAQIVNPTVGAIAYQDTIDPVYYSIDPLLPVKVLNENIEVNGSLNYSVDFEVPKGAGGLQPTLGLNYSSTFMDGFSGIGFNISGLSSIDRVNKTIYHDSTSVSITGTKYDRFALDGKRLILNTGTYGITGSTYGTELEEFSKIVAVGSSGTDQGPQSFKVYTKSGLIMEYGNTSDARILGSGTTVLSWKLNKVTNRFNNSIIYSYYEYDDERPVTLISYNGNTAQIKFKYKQRSDISNYVYGGIEFTRNILLDNIEITNNSALFKRYELAYMLDNKSQLQKVTEFNSSGQKMNPTVFSWTKQTDGLYESTTFLNDGQAYYTRDYNGDGISDLVCITSTIWKLYVGSASGIMQYVTQGSLISGSAIVPGDFNGDGKDDMMIISWHTGDYYYAHYYQSTETGFTQNTPFRLSKPYYQVTGISFLAVDYNGDGKEELMDIGTEYGPFYDGSYPVVNSSKDFYHLYSVTGQLINSNHVDSFGKLDHYKIPVAHQIDFNGDGRTDLLCLYSNGYKMFEFNGSNNTLIETKSGTNITSNNLIRIGDFNGDGISDVLKTSGPTNPVWSVLYYTQSGFIEKTINGMPNLSFSTANIYFGNDFNGDGKTDIILLGKGNNLNNSANHFFLCINKGNGLDYNINEYTFNISLNLTTIENYIFGDFYGDGRMQLFYNYSGTSRLYSYTSGTPGNLMKTTINGHGAKTTVNYLPMTNTSVYTKGSGATYPLIDLGAPVQLVSSAVTDNGTVTPTTTTNYTYSGAKAHLQGKGFLGFSKLTAANNASGVTSETYIDFDLTFFYPKVSLVINKKAWTLLSTDSCTWERQIVLNKRIFPFIKSTKQINNLTGQSVYTEYSYFPHATYGNLEKIKTSYNGSSHTKETVFAYTDERPDSFLIGRPTTVDETYIRDAVTTTKKITRTYKTTSNAVETETYNPGDASSWVLTREYDTRGNVKKEIRSATGIASQTTEFTFDTSTGVNLEKVKNTNLGLETNYTYYQATGLLKDEIDPFGNKITYAYDNSDQLYTVTPTTGVTKTITRGYNFTGAPALASFLVKETGTDGTDVRTWFDKTGKDIRNETKGLFGTMIKTDKEYYASGLLNRFSEPTTGTPSNWNTYAYYTADNRLNTFTPKFGPAETYSYANAVTTKTLNERDYSATLNNDNSVLSKEDPAGTITFAYWPDGTLKSTITPEGLTTSMTYDKNGNRLTITDPSAGTITNTWYGTGQQKTSTNANGKLTTWYYQPNGLLDSVVTAGQTTDYTYNTKGQVITISSPDGVSRSYGYYPNGLLQTLTESVDGVSNTVSFTYDSYGRMYKKTFNSADYEQYDYNYGYLYKISFNGTAVWQATTIDEYSRISAASIGATTATWGYNATTNMLSQIKGTGVQQYDYDFNGSTGNLNWRTNTLKSKTENFGYDAENLDRLVSVTGDSAQTIGYNATIKGNIETKTDVGIYTYDATKKYAVKTITNGLNISTTAQGIVYNAFNKVQTITEGTKTAEFVYNADRQRIRMTLKTSGATTKTRYYFGGSCEREVVGSTTMQTIWIGGDSYTAVAVATKVGTGSWTVYNIFRDHLGTITHLKTGSTITEFSYDAWGRRRDKDDWSYTLTSEPALFADRGFTNHEFLADFNLYNMNGRLYDPVVGRFLSPDPFVQDPSFSQSYNRYSYALNNPLKYTDPSGESWKSFWNKIGNWFTRNNIQFQVGVNMSGSGTVPFAKAVGPNFNIDTRNFAQVPTAGYQKINQQLAGFSGWNNNSSPRFGNGDIINQQFVGESPMAGGVAQNSWDFQSSIYASSVVLNLLVSTEEINTGLNLTSTLQKANAYKSITNTIPKSLRLELDYARMTNTLAKSFSTKLFFAGGLYTVYEVQKNPTLDNAAWGILDTSVGGLALVSGYATIPALFYYVGRIGNDIYQISKPQEPLIFQSKGWQELKRNGY